jgi:hypothetical protein
MRANERRLIVVLSVLAFGTQLGGLCVSNPTKLFVDTPVHGSFSTASMVTVSGSVEIKQVSDALLTVNGAPVVVQPDKSWSIDLALDPAKVFNPFLVQLTNLSGNVVRRKRVVVISGESAADGDFSLDSLALRLNDTGLDAVEPLVSTLVDLDIAALLPVGTEVISNYCAVRDPLFGFCVGEVDVEVDSPPPTFSSFGLNVDSMDGFAAGDVMVHDVRVDLYINGSGLAPSCGLRVTADSVSILGDYQLSPDAGDPTLIDVNLMGQPGVAFDAFDDEFTSGLCDFPLIGDLIQLIIGDIQPVVTDGLRDFLADPDGGGPQDAPIAEGIEVALADISIAGEIGAGLGLNLEAPLFTVDEDDDGITLGSDARVTSDPCTPPPGAPDLSGSLHVPEAFPTFGATTPISGLPYGLGICIGTSAFNQLLKAEVECGLLATELTQIDFGGGPVAITAGVLSLFIPELANVDPNLPLTVRLQPTLAPVVTGNPGPQGELAELRMGGLNVELYEPSNDVVLVDGQIDFRAGLDFAFDDMAGELVPTLGTVAAGDISVDIVGNTIMTNPTQLATVLEFLLPSVLPTLGDSLGSFPLPQFLGLDLQSVAVEQNGEFISLFADLVQSP